MKLSALAFFGFLTVATADDFIVRTVVTAATIPAEMTKEIVSGMETVQENVAETLAEISGNGRALLGQDWIGTELVGHHRELPAEACTAPYTNCENWCCGYAFGRCYTAFPNDFIVYNTCGGWRELKDLSEEEVEQLGEDERHRHLSAAATCAESVAAVRESIELEMAVDVYALIKDKLVHTCFVVSPP